MFKWLKELIWKLRGGLDGEFKRGHKDADKAWRKATKKSAQHCMKPTCYAANCWPH